MAELIAEAFLDGKRHIRTNEHEDTDAMSMPWHRETQYHAWVPIMTGCINFCTYCTCRTCAVAKRAVLRGDCRRGDRFGTPGRA